MTQRLVISNYPDSAPRNRQVFLRPFESFVLHLTNH
jgi:trehalose-6-phosphate hydrolase